MGTYRAPGQVIDRSYDEANKQIAGSINKYDKLFAIKKEEQRLQMEKNEKLQEKIELNRVNGYDKFNAEVRRVTPKGGFVDNMTPFVENLADEYASLYGKTDPASLRRMNQLIGIPQQAADGQGAMAAIDLKYSKSLGLDKDAPNSINSRLTNSENWAYVDSYHDQDGGIIPNEVGGRLQWKLGESNLNNSVFVNGALEGQDFLKYNGDPMSITDPIVEGIMTDLKYENAGEKIIDKTNPKLHTITTSFKKANDKFRERISDPKLYEPILKQQNKMETIYGARLIKEVEAIAAAEGKDSEAAKLLYGEDGRPGGDDDPEGIWDANKEGGPWVGSDGKFEVSDTQRKIAIMGLIAIASSDHYLKPDEVSNQQTRLTPTYDKSTYTPTAFDRNVSKSENINLYNDNLKFSQEIAGTMGEDFLYELEVVRLKNGTIKEVKRSNRDNVVRENPGSQIIKGGPTQYKAVEKLANKLNQINESKVDTKNPISQGEYFVNKNGELAFKDKEGQVQSMKNIDLTNSDAINRLLTVQGEGMDGDVFDYFKNKKGGSGSGTEMSVDDYLNED
ncbi:hypothetical protein H8D85_00215 [bacterium]|nr:hypothetical protein [bacterium]